MIRLSFSTRGFDNLAIGGQKILGSNAAQFGATESDENNKSKDAWGYALLGVAAIALGVVVLGGGGEAKMVGCPPGSIFIDGRCAVP